MNDKLKPCPFCGGEARLIGHSPYSITCCKCRATTVICDTPEKAIDAWNGRREQFEKSQQKEGNPSDALSYANLSRYKSKTMLTPESPKWASRSCTWWDRDPANEDGAFESQLGSVADGVANRVDRLKAIGNGQVPLVAATAFNILKKEFEEDRI